MEEINIIKQNYLYRKDIHRLIGKRRDINDYVLKNKTANYLIKNIFDDKLFETIVMEMAEMYSVDNTIIEQDMTNFLKMITSVNMSEKKHLTSRQGIPLDLSIDELEFPMSIEIEITKRCNWKCKFCYNVWKYTDVQDEEIDMSWDTYRDIIDECAVNGCNNIRISGGEPTLHPMFKTFIQYAHEKGFRISIFTNATLLNKEIVDFLKDNDVENVLISLHGTNEMHDSFTGIKGSFDKTIEKIELLVKNNICVSVETILSGKLSENIILEMSQILNNIGIEYWNFMPYVPTGSVYDDEYSVNAREAIGIVKKINEEQKMNIRVVCSQKLCLDTYEIEDADSNYFIDGNCAAGILWMSVSYEGKLRNCPHSNIYAGYVSDGIKKIYVEKIKPRIISIYENKPKECKSCIVYESCKGGCHLNKIERY